MPPEMIVPILRGKLVRAVADAGNARTVRDRQAKFAEAYAYSEALNLIRTGDTTWVTGIAGRYWGGEVLHCRETFLQGDDRDLLGLRLDDE
jgi:hypothetical protein